MNFTDSGKRLDRFNFRVLTLFVFLSAIAGMAPASEYFVALDGSDARDGLSRENAFRSIQYGLDKLEPGDILTIAPGEYRESASRKGFGDLDRTTLIRAETSGTVILRGDIPIPEIKNHPEKEHVYYFETTNEVQCVNELDSLTRYRVVPNLEEIKYHPGTFYPDPGSGRVYFSTSDWQPPERHYLTQSVIKDAGFMLRHATNVVIEGLVATGFNKNNKRQHEPGTIYGARVGIGVMYGTNVVIRHCRAFMNASGIVARFSGNPLIEHSEGYSNRCVFDNSGDIICFDSIGGTIRHCRTTMGSGEPVMRFYGRLQGVCHLEDSISTGGMYFKGGSARHGIMKRCITSDCVIMYSTNTYNSIVTKALADGADESNIICRDFRGLRSEEEFADPLNYDYRLQENSRFRNAAGGKDKGLQQYEANIFYVSTKGDDEASGLSVSSAWRSVAKALSALRAGDTLYFLPGSYSEDLVARTEGTKTEPVYLRARGNGHVVLSGSVDVEKNAFVEMERLNFTGRVRYSDSSDLSLMHCAFRQTATAENIDGLSIKHCAFADGLELASCSRYLIRDNIFDNRNRAALGMTDSMRGLAAWNAFSNVENCRAVYRNGDEKHETTPVVSGIDAEPYGRHLVPSFTDPERGVFTLSNEYEFKGRSSMGTPVGPYRPVKKQQSIIAPHVLARTATTADIEWRTSVKSTSEILWGTTEACENTVVLRYGERSFHTISLVGLTPGTTYYFKIRATTPAYETHGNPEAIKADNARRRTTLVSESMTLETLTSDPEPVVYHVSTNGSDGASGLSEEAAWRSISHAATKAGPGDVVLVGAGVYPETVRFRRSGSVEAPLLFRCKPGEKAWLSGNNLELSFGMQIVGKYNVQVDGLYFRDYGSANGGAAIYINGGKDNKITRCFHDGRFPGYTGGFIRAIESTDLLVKNCFMTRGFNGPQFWSCRDLIFENSVLYINQIGMIFFIGKPEDNFNFRRNVFVDNIVGKSMQHLMLLSYAEQMEEGDNCYYLRVPEAERILVKVQSERYTWEEFNSRHKRTSSSIFADPMLPVLPNFTVFDSLEAMAARGRAKDAQLAAERLSGKEIDFDDFFCRNPELIRRDIGLQPSAFEDFVFKSGKTGDK